jgi:hypothetical protein
MSGIFEIVQAMSGQKNCIVIPRPYLKYFEGDQQVFALAAVLNQLVFWSGKSSQENDWFYKSHDELGKEVGGMSGDQIRRVVEKLSHKYLPDAVEVTTRKVNGTPVKHYRINGDALIAKIFPSALETAESPNGKREDVVSNTQKRRKETAKLPNESGEVAESILYPDQYTDHYSQINKTLLSENSGESPDAQSDIDFLVAHPEAAIYTPNGNKWGIQQDVDCAKWLFDKKKELFERNQVASPKQPNWTDWANDIRLMRTIDGHSHREICAMYLAVTRDEFWCRNVLSTSKLREKWDELTLKLTAAKDAPIDAIERDAAFRRFIGSGRPLRNPSETEQMAIRMASKEGVGRMREGVGVARWNAIWKECAQRQTEEQTA